MSLFMLVGIVTVILIPESDKPSKKHNDSGWLQKSLVDPFAEFLREMVTGHFFFLMFIAIYRVSDLIIGIAANPFYADIGFSLSEIATVTKVFGFTPITIIGAFIGGLTVARFWDWKIVDYQQHLIDSDELIFLILE